ncbi:MAG: GNAT family N-acetyltransferase [Defluviitaleaceae bacterium]|nr:GNAT family N-acetyltransferase [Defluviitaleaceae bacterium]
MTIKEVRISDEKSRICDKILRALPDWFGIEESIAGYVAEVRDLPFFAAYADDSEPIGFAALKPHNEYTAEVCVMGVLRPYHRQGAGKALIDRCVDECARAGRVFLTVKTLADTHPDEGYAKTRLFYRAMGFRPLEVFPELWDPSNPCLLMARYLG